jgi:hypothetical protein
MERATATLLAGTADQFALERVLAESCPGKLLEAANQDVAARLAAVRDYFSALAADRLEGVFGLSGAFFRDAGSHRKKTQQTLRQMLELAILWITEILRAKQGLPGRIRGRDYERALELQARQFDEVGLLRAASVIERGLGLAAINVDMGLLAGATLFNVAEALEVGALGGSPRTHPAAN